jgi:hypothetical protein
MASFYSTAGSISMAKDYYECYFSEKLWESIPSVYRHEDGLKDRGVLRALVEVLATQAAVLRRSHDRLWEDQFIELCDDWVVPYIGDLLNTRLVSSLNRRARRIDVAKTIYYRRRAGTLAVLEELISDITGWEGHVVEGFRSLARSQYRLDPPPVPPDGSQSNTLPGGWADLRRPVATELAGTAFDEFYHTADLRRHRGKLGRYNINKLVFHLYRIPALHVSDVTPCAVTQEANGYTFDPSGRDVPLFIKRNRPMSNEDEVDWARWRTTREWELPAPMRNRLLNHAEYKIDEELIQDLVDNNVISESLADELRRLLDHEFANERLLYRALKSLPSRDLFLDENIYFSIVAGALSKHCGKYVLLTEAVNVEESPNTAPKPLERICATSLEEWSVQAPGKNLVIDSERGRFLFPGELPGLNFTVSYYYGFSANIGAGTYGRYYVEERVPNEMISTGGGDLHVGSLSSNKITQIDDSATYLVTGDQTQVEYLTFQAANGQRPHLRLNGDWMFDSGSCQNAELYLDGLWIGTLAADIKLILEGDYKYVKLQSVTLDPGGEQTEDSDADTIPAITLVIRGHIDHLELDSCICGPIRTEGDGLVEKFSAHDSIIQSIDNNPALLLSSGDTNLDRVTIMGGLKVHRLWASEVIVTGTFLTGLDNNETTALVTDFQEGCFRFSAAYKEGCQLPRRYESHWIENPGGLFVSYRFGNPGYAQLSEAAPEFLHTGAENGSEIGAFNRLINPIKLKSLKAKVDEFMPFGLIPIYITES